ncbi:MAG: hypothetical protein ACTHQM_22525 [Thermoanaerobaculia bacterium]
MNYDLAIMALEGMSRAPMSVRNEDGQIVIEAAPATFKELARLCLLLGGVQTAEDAFELEPGVHVTSDSSRLTLRLQVE